MNDAMMMNEYIAVDLETTGLNAKLDKILEIGALRIKDGVVCESFQAMINPGIPVPAYITELTGITEEEARGGIPVQTAMEQFLQFAGELPLLGHNILFDYSFLKVQAVNMNRPFERKACDTLKIARKAFPGLPSRSLEAMCAYYQIDRTHAHRAYDDAKATEELYRLMAQEFMEEHLTWFEPATLCYKAKKQSPVTEAQKRYLNDLIKYHKMKNDTAIETLTKSEASRLIDKIILTHGKIER